MAQEFNTQGLFGIEDEEKDPLKIDEDMLLFQQAQKPVTFRDYSVPESPRGSGLSVFTRSGKVKQGVDVSAITPAPETLLKPSEVNTALNQEVQVGSPSVDEPGYFQKLKEFGQSVFGRDQGIFDIDRLGKGADNLLGSAMRNLTPVEDRRFANNEPFGKTFTDTFAITKADGTKFYPDKVAPQTGVAQAATEASASEVTPSVTPTIETPSGGAQGQVGAVQSPFLQSPSTPSGLGGPLLRGFNMVNDAARGPNAPMGRDATRAALGGMTLNEYLNAPASTPGVSGLSTDPQGRMIPSFTNESGQDPRSFYAQQSAAREARLGARPDFNAAISDREGRGKGEMSMADAVDLAGGDRKKARAMIVSQRLGRDPFTGAAGQTAADRAKSDLELATAIQSYNQAQAAEQRRIAAEGRAVRGEERTVAQIAKEDAHANKTQEMRERELRLKEARLMNDISQVDPSTIPTIDAAQEFMDENDLVWDGGVLYSKSGWLNGTLTEVTNPAFMNVKGMKILRDLSRGTAVPANTATPDYSGYSIRPR